MQNPRSFLKLGYRKYDFFSFFSSSAVFIFIFILKDGEALKPQPTGKTNTNYSQLQEGSVGLWWVGRVLLEAR